MDSEAKKTTLRMVPYGLYVLTSINGEQIAASTVSWVTQTSFDPPLLAVGIKVDSHTFGVVKDSGAFALNFLDDGQKDVAITYFKSHAPEGETIGGQPFVAGQETGAPILHEAARAHVECRVREISAIGDHATVIAEVVDAAVHRAPEGRAEQATLSCEDIGPTTYYAG